MTEQIETELVVIDNAPPPMVRHGAEVVPVLDRLMQAAQAGMSADMIERFMDLAERNERREAEKAFHRAFAAFKADPPEIVKNKLVDFLKRDGTRTTYKHATIGDVVGGIIKGMSKHGLSHRWDIVQDSKNITVVCHITHELGHSETTSLSAGADESGGKNAIQSIGSTITYLQRYTLQAATGIAVLEADDDGNGAGEQTIHPKLQAGRDAALNGMKPLTDWWASLGKDDQKALQKDFGNLRSAARRIDEGRS